MRKLRIEPISKVEPTESFLKEKEQPICVNCKYYKFEYASNRCYAKAIKGLDFITGKNIYTGVKDCFTLNRNGGCILFKHYE